MAKLPIVSESETSLDVFFEKGSSKLPEEGRLHLKTIAALMTAYPFAHINIETSAKKPDGTFYRGQSLSDGLAVRSFLMDNGVDSNQITTAALPMSGNIADDDFVKISFVNGEVPPEVFQQALETSIANPSDSVEVLAGKIKSMEPVLAAKQALPAAEKSGGGLSFIATAQAKPKEGDEAPLPASTGGAQLALDRNTAGLSLGPASSTKIEAPALLGGASAQSPFIGLVFEEGSTSLSPRHFPLLIAASILMKMHPDEKLEVIGPNFKAVQNALHHYGVDPARIVTKPDGNVSSIEVHFMGGIVTPEQIGKAVDICDKNRDDSMEILTAKISKELSASVDVAEKDPVQVFQDFINANRNLTHLELAKKIREENRLDEAKTFLEKASPEQLENAFPYDSKVRDYDLFTALLLESKGEMGETLKQAFARSEDLNIKDAIEDYWVMPSGDLGEGHNAFYYAALNSQLDTIKWLKQQYDETGASFRNALEKEGSKFLVYCNDETRKWLMKHMIEQKDPAWLADVNKRLDGVNGLRGDLFNEKEIQAATPSSQAAPAAEDERARGADASLIPSAAPADRVVSVLHKEYLWDLIEDFRDPEKRPGPGSALRGGFDAVDEDFFKDTLAILYGADYDIAALTDGNYTSEDEVIFNEIQARLAREIEGVKPDQVNRDTLLSQLSVYLYDKNAAVKPVPLSNIERTEMMLSVQALLGEENYPRTMFGKEAEGLARAILSEAIDKIKALPAPPAKTPVAPPLPSPSAKSKEANPLQRPAVEVDDAKEAVRFNFPAGQSGLPDGSTQSLDAIVGYLKNNPEARIQVASHTNGAGDDNQDRRMSLSQALAVRTYLVDKGIDESRMDIRALGSSQVKERGAFVNVHLRDGNDRKPAWGPLKEVLGLSNFPKVPAPASVPTSAVKTPAAPPAAKPAASAPAPKAPAAKPPATTHTTSVSSKFDWQTAEAQALLYALNHLKEPEADGIRGKRTNGALASYYKAKDPSIDPAKLSMDKIVSDLKHGVVAKKTDPAVYAKIKAIMDEPQNSKIGKDAARTVQIALNVMGYRDGADDTIKVNGVVDNDTRSAYARYTQALAFAFNTSADKDSKVAPPDGTALKTPVPAAREEISTDENPALYDAGIKELKDLKAVGISDEQLSKGILAVIDDDGFIDLDNTNGKLVVLSLVNGEPKIHKVSPGDRLAGVQYHPDLKERVERDAEAAVREQGQSMGKKFVISVQGVGFIVQVDPEDSKAFLSSYKTTISAVSLGKPENLGHEVYKQEDLLPQPQAMREDFGR